MSKSFPKKQKFANIYQKGNLFIIKLVIIAILLLETTSLRLNENHLTFQDLQNSQNSPLSHLASDQIQTISIVCINDLHGHSLPLKLKHPKTNETYNYGGLEYMVSMIQTIKTQNQNQVLIFSAGDQIQGGLQASPLVSNGSIISSFLNRINVSAHTVGNHQFDFGPTILQNYLNNVKSIDIVSNLVNVDKNSPQKILFPLANQKQYKVYNLTVKKNLANGNQDQSKPVIIRIGVISLLTIQTLTTTTGFQDRNETNDNKKFPESYVIQSNYSSIVKKLSQKLRTVDKVHAVLLMGHLGNQYNNSNIYQNTSYTEDSNFPFQGLGKKNQIKALIDQIIQAQKKDNIKVLDGIIQGHRHTTSHYFYKGIPVVGSMNDGLYFNVLYLNFTVDYLNQQIKFMKEDTKIEGPIAVCQKVFHFSNTCTFLSLREALNSAKILTLQTNYFHGVKVTADQEYLESISQYSQSLSQYSKSIIYLNLDKYLTKDYRPNSEIGKIVLRTMADQLRYDNYSFNFLIYNGGGFRGNWFPGNITQRTLYDMFPFEGELYKFKVNGFGLKQILNQIQKGSKGFYPTDGLIMYTPNVSLLKQHNGTNNKIYNVTIRKTKEEQNLNPGSGLYQWLDPNKIYTGISSDFLLNGGDDFQKIKDRFKSKQLLKNQNNQIMTLRSILRNGFQRLNSDDQKQINQKMIQDIDNQFNETSFIQPQTKASNHHLKNQHEDLNDFSNHNSYMQQSHANFIPPEHTPQLHTFGISYVDISHGHKSQTDQLYLTAPQFH